MEITKNEFNESLVEVRKAYRLLHAYQKRIIDLVKFIGNHWNFNFISGNPWFSDGLPRRSSVTLNNQSWDWLPMYYYNFFFEKANSKLKFGVIIQADTGFFDSGLNKNIEKQNVKNFHSVEESETRIILMVSNEKWKSDAVRLDNNFGKDKLEYPSDEKTIADKDVMIIAKAFLLVDFINEESTKSKLIEFENFCKNKGIKIN